MTQDNNPGTPNQRLVAYGIIGAGLGALAVWLIADAFSFGSLGAGLIGGAVAGVLAGFVRMKAGLDN